MPTEHRRHLHHGLHHGNYHGLHHGSQNISDFGERKKAHVSDASYLRATVGHKLSQALHDVCLVHPLDPIEYIAKWLYKSEDSELYFHEKAIFSTELQIMGLQLEKENANRQARILELQKNISKLKIIISEHKLERLKLLRLKKAEMKRRQEAMRTLESSYHSWDDDSGSKRRLSRRSSSRSRSASTIFKSSTETSRRSSRTTPDRAFSIPHFATSADHFSSTASSAKDSTELLRLAEDDFSHFSRDITEPSHKAPKHKKQSAATRGKRPAHHPSKRQSTMRDKRLLKDTSDSDLNEKDRFQSPSEDREPRQGQSVDKNGEEERQSTTVTRETLLDMAFAAGIVSDFVPTPKRTPKGKRRAAKKVQEEEEKQPSLEPQDLKKQIRALSIGSAEDLVEDTSPKSKKKSFFDSPRSWDSDSDVSEDSDDMRRSQSQPSLWDVEAPLEEDEEDGRPSTLPTVHKASAARRRSKRIVKKKRIRRASVTDVEDAWPAADRTSESPDDSEDKPFRRSSLHQKIMSQRLSLMVQKRRSSIRSIGTSESEVSTVHRSEMEVTRPDDEEVLEGGAARSRKYGQKKMAVRRDQKRKKEESKKPSDQKHRPKHVDAVGTSESDLPSSFEKALAEREDEMEAPVAKAEDTRTEKERQIRRRSIKKMILKEMKRQSMETTRQSLLHEVAETTDSDTTTYHSSEKALVEREVEMETPMAKAEDTRTEQEIKARRRSIKKLILKEMKRQSLDATPQLLLPEVAGTTDSDTTTYYSTEVPPSVELTDDEEMRQQPEMLVTDDGDETDDAMLRPKTIVRKGTSATISLPAGFTGKRKPSAMISLPKDFKGKRKGSVLPPWEPKDDMKELKDDMKEPKKIVRKGTRDVTDLRFQEPDSDGSSLMPKKIIRTPTKAVIEPYFGKVDTEQLEAEDVEQDMVGEDDDEYQEGDYTWQSEGSTPESRASWSPPDRDSGPSDRQIVLAGIGTFTRKIEGGRRKKPSRQTRSTLESEFSDEEAYFAEDEELESGADRSTMSSVSSAKRDSILPAIAAATFKKRGSMAAARRKSTAPKTISSKSKITREASQVDSSPNISKIKKYMYEDEEARAEEKRTEEKGTEEKRTEEKRTHEKGTAEKKTAGKRRRTDTPREKVYVSDFITSEPTDQPSPSDLQMEEVEDMFDDRLERMSMSEGQLRRHSIRKVSDDRDVLAGMPHYTQSSSSDDYKAKAEILTTDSSDFLGDITYISSDTSARADRDRQPQKSSREMSALQDIQGDERKYRDTVDDRKDRTSLDRSSLDRSRTVTEQRYETPQYHEEERPEISKQKEASFDDGMLGVKGLSRKLTFTDALSDPSKKMARKDSRRDSVKPYKATWSLIEPSSLVCNHPALGSILSHPLPVMPNEELPETWETRGYEWTVFYDHEIYVHEDPHFDDDAYKKIMLTKKALLK